MLLCACVCVRACMSLHICVHVRLFVWVCMGMCGYAWACVGMHGHVWVCMGMCGYAWACVGMHGHVCVCVYSVCVSKCMQWRELGLSTLGPVSGNLTMQLRSSVMVMSMPRAKFQGLQIQVLSTPLKQCDLVVIITPHYPTPLKQHDHVMIIAHHTTPHHWNNTTVAITTHCTAPHHWNNMTMWPLPHTALPHTTETTWPCGHCRTPFYFILFVKNRNHKTTLKHLKNTNATI